MILLRNVTSDDLELMLAWRNNPIVYEGFYEQGYQKKGHIVWKSWIIRYENRNIGVVWVLKSSSAAPEIGIYIGEVTLHGQGIGKGVLSLVIELLKVQGHSKVIAKVLKNNQKSKRLFESCGFNRNGEWRKGEWLYEYSAE